jgi:HKD family nuclease
MTAHRALVPGAVYPDGLLALTALAEGARRVRAAVAFVTATGADLLESLIDAEGPLIVELVTRGAPITEPAALERLAKLGVAVSVVVGNRASHFHPKLWLLEHEDGLRVLAGSGNLTRGGLCDNDEQFEVLEIATKDHADCRA